MSSLARYLEDRGETQQQFAKRIGMSQPNVSKLCSENPRLSLSAALRISDATDGEVPVDSWSQFKVLGQTQNRNAEQYTNRSGGISERLQGSGS
ncbi:helix-turn-helix transcriptional regulator [Aestuariibius insulae]|uniref:helix-turn-helix transcriptional regulator n=1 Tax=Aestuariibius insulae TaxID=2058287 RepID=UPI00345EAC34